MPPQVTRVLLPDNTITTADSNSYFLWVRHLNEKKELFHATNGKPTFPLPAHIPQAMIKYWSQAASTLEPIMYGDPQGEFQYRKKIADGFSKEYQLDGVFQAEDIAFTLGGTGAIHSIFYAINTLYPGKKMVTTLPYYPSYSLYKKESKIFLNKSKHFRYINLLKYGNLTLNNEALKDFLQTIKKWDIAAFLFCDPNNPNGTTPGKEEWQKIAETLKKYPTVPIIIDEAYCEMVFDQPHVSLVTAAPELLDRIIIMRSATKGLSAAGERMAVVLSKNQKIIGLISKYVSAFNINIPISLQYAYAETISQIQSTDYIKLANFYKEKIEYMKSKLAELDILPKDIIYQPNSTFYLIADLSQLKGKIIEAKAKEILVDNQTGKIETDIDIVYHFLFKHKLAIAPLCFFGVDQKRCWVRITCADPIDILDKIALILKDELGPTQKQGAYVNNNKKQTSKEIKG
jgi:aspartate aminotransferase/aminotransferase